MDEELKEFQAALLRSVKEMNAGKFTRKTVFEVAGDQVRQVSQELPAPKTKPRTRRGSGESF